MFQNGFEGIGLDVVQRDAFQSFDKKVPVPVAANVSDIVFVDAQGIFFIGLEYVDTRSVVAIQTVECPDPDESEFILVDGVDGVLR